MSNVRSAEKSRISTCSAADAVALAVIEKYRELQKLDSKSDSQLVLSGIVAISNSENLQVVSIGVGNKFHPQGLKSETMVRDFHAEILARRAFKRLLIEEYVIINAGGISSFFEKVESGKIRLRKHMQLVLYVSSCPCGNACIRRWGDSPKETTNLLLGELEIFNDAPHAPFQAHSIHEGQAAVTFKGQSGIFSCSDKILRWNVFGLQGSRLSSLVDRINLSGIVIGRKFVRKHAERAFCCRLNYKRIDNEIKMNLHHPSLMCTAVKLDESVFDTDSETGAVFSDLCMWWNFHMKNPEILNSSSTKSLLSRESFGILLDSALIPPISTGDAEELSRKLDEQLRRLGSL